MRNPLYDDLCKTLGTYTISFHTPGHKYKAMQDLALMRIDTTEIDGTDHLHHSKGILKEAQERVARAYGSKRSFFLVNGTTCGIHAMILATIKKGQKLLIQRDSHKSVYNACALFNIPVLFLEPRVDQKLGIPTGISMKQLATVLENDASIGAVLLTSPNYFGLISAIDEAADLCHMKGIPLLVDEAHGAHLAFSELLPTSAVALGADMVCQSTHKTLPAMTQAAVLHVCSERVPIDQVMLSLEVIQTSSPSYVLMNSIDYAVYFAALHGSRLTQTLCHHLSKIRKSLRLKIGLKDMQLGFKRFGPDPLRWIIPSEPFKMSGYALEQQLRDHYGIQMELASERYVLAIVTMLNSHTELEVLEDALTKIYLSGHDQTYVQKPFVPHKAKYNPVLTLHEAFHAEAECVDLAHAEGRVLRTAIVPYPPGVPFVLPGERLTKERLLHVKALVASQEVSGVNDGQVYVIQD